MKIVELEWIDAIFQPGQIDEICEVKDCVLIHTIGYLIKEDNEGITLAMEVMQDGSLRHVTTIPKAIVKKRKKIS